MTDYPEGPVTVTCDGFDVRIYPRQSLLGRALYDDTTSADGMQVIETEVEAVLDSAAFDGMTAVDVGANWGYHALRLAANCDPDRILAVEAHPAVRETLRHNVNLNDAPIEIDERAVADDAGTAELWELGEAADLNTLATETYDHSGPEIRETHAVETVTLADLLADWGLDSVDLCKIDVEGAEGRVLAGLDGACDHVDGIALEVHPLRMADFGDEPADLVHLLREAGLSSVYHFDNDGGIDRLAEPVSEWVDGRFAVRDEALHTLVASRPETRIHDRFAEACPVGGPGPR